MLNWFVIIVSVLHFSAVSAAFWCSHTILAFCGLLLFIFVEVYLLSGAELANSDLKAKCIALDKLIEARIEEVGEDALVTERHLRWFAQKSLLEFFQNHKAYVIFCLPNGKGVQNGGISQKIINAFMIIKRHTPFPFSYMIAVSAIPGAFIAECMQYRMLKKSGLILWDIYSHLIEK